jgi:CheY-like chemotaxis protein
MDGNTPQSVNVDAKLNILLVDDSLSILKMSSMMLRRQGHSVSTAENGAIAVDMMDTATSTQVPFDVVLMDLQMPVMDGLEATSRIRGSEKAAAKKWAASAVFTEQSTQKSDEQPEIISIMTPFSLKRPMFNQFDHQLIIGVSACSDNETMEAAFAAGIDAFIPKPFTLRSFKDTYNGLVAKRWASP